MNFYKKINILFVVCVVGCYFLINQTRAETNQESADQVPGELLIKSKSSDHVFNFKFSPESDLQEIIENYRANPEIEYVEPNYLFTAQLEPLDTYYTQQTYLTYTQNNKAWNYTQGSPKVVIAIVDTGVDLEHPDLRQNIWKNEDEIAGNGVDDDNNGFIDDINGWDFLENKADANPKFSSGYTKVGMNHGTVVAGVAAGRGGNNEGIAGVSWYSKIMSLRCLDGAGIGDTLSVSKAIDYARLNGAHIINLSFVGEGKSQTLTQAIERAYEAGVLVVAAAGNEVMNGVDFDKVPMYPVCQDIDSKSNTVIGVGSLDDNDRKSSFSNFGVHCLDINAPGVKVFSTQYYNKSLGDEFNKYYGSGWTGTSVSAPQVSGLAALIKSVKPEISLSELQKIILDNSDNIDHVNREWLGKMGRGRINAYKAIAAAQSYTYSEPVTERTLLITGAGIGGGPQLSVYENKKLISRFFAFDKNLRNGVSVASGSLDGDGKSQIIVGSGPGSQPEVRIFNLLGQQRVKFLAYRANFNGGINVTAGDINNDGRDEIITAPYSKGGPHVKIFSSTGELVGQFFAHDENYRGSLSLTTADINDDGRQEIIVGLGANTLPLVKAYDYRGSLVHQFFAFDLNYRSGLSVSSGDVDNDRNEEIIVSPLSGYRPLIKVFSKIGAVKSEFLAYPESIKVGIRTSVGDFNHDGLMEIITGQGAGGGSLVRIFNFSGQIKDELYIYDKKLRLGINPAIIN